jgi:general secretion pathway protein A
LIIQDEAHLLHPELLEEYRLIGNLETGGGRAAQVVLLSQPDILETLKKSYFESFRQRITFCPSLEPLGKYEAADYLIHHARIAQKLPGYFTESALEKLVSFSCGIPRILNQVGELSHQQVTHAGQKRLDLEHVQTAIELLKRPWIKVRENKEFDLLQNIDRVQGPEVRLLNHGELGWTA